MSKVLQHHLLLVNGIIKVLFGLTDNPTILHQYSTVLNACPSSSETVVIATIIAEKVKEKQQLLLHHQHNPEHILMLLSFFKKIVNHNIPKKGEQYSPPRCGQSLVNSTFILIPWSENFTINYALQHNLNPATYKVFNCSDRKGPRMMLEGKLGVENERNSNIKMD